MRVRVVVFVLCELEVGGFDLLEDEAVVDNHAMDSADLLPDEWTDTGNPGFTYYCYYVYANLVSLNQLRRYRVSQRFVRSSRSPSSVVPQAGILWVSIGNGVKYGGQGQSGQMKPSHCFRLHPTRQ